MNLANRLLRSLFYLVEISGTIAIILFSCSVSAADGVTLVNHTDRVLYLRLFNGLCSAKPTTPFKSLAVNPNANIPPISPAVGNAVCYIASRVLDPNQAPIYCGSVTVPATVTFDSSMAYCTSKDSSKGPVARHVPLPKKPLAREGCADCVYVDDETRLHVTLLSWTDPLTPPQTEANCTNMASGDWPWGGGWETCMGWEIDCQWMQNQLNLTVRSQLSTTYQMLEPTVTACINDGLVWGAVAGVVAAITTGAGGVAAAEETFQDVFLTCLWATIPNDIIGVSLDINSHWSDWGACIHP